MAKLPRLIMSKMDTIRSDDPFKTDKLEAAASKVVQDAFTRFDKVIRDRLKQVIEQHELEYDIPSSQLESVVKKVLDPGIAELQTDDLVAESWEYVQKGYMNGIQFSSKMLEPLGIKVNINLSDKDLKKSLDDIQDEFEKEISDWISDNEQAYTDLVTIGLEKGKSLMEIYEDIEKQYKVGLGDAKRIADNKIIQAARDAHKEILITNGIEISRWITVTDSRTCDTCLALNGMIFKDDTHGRGLVNIDSGDFLETILSDLTPDERFINPGEGKDGPQLHDYCRCVLQPVMTEDQYRGNVAGRTITEI